MEIHLATMATISNLVDDYLGQHWIALTALGHIVLIQVITASIRLTSSYYNVVRDQTLTSVVLLMA